MRENKKAEEKIFSLRDELLIESSQKKINGILQTIDILKYSSIADQFLQAGDQAPDFLLPNALGDWFSLKEQVKQGKVLLVFIRGGWSPYCYLQLRKIQENISKIKSLNTQVLVISSEKKDYCLNTIERNALEFEVLSDYGNRVAGYYNLVYKSENNQLLNDMGENSPIKILENSYQLPLPATFIIDEWMSIRYAFASPDYRIRPQIDEVLERL